VFVCLYNESSFPTAWCEVVEEECCLGPAAQDGIYLVRIVPRRDLRTAAPDLRTELGISIEKVS
jgi:hypothetical protein